MQTKSTIGFLSKQYSKVLIKCFLLNIGLIFATNNVMATSLPSDATDLTSGSYLVEYTGSIITHDGNVKISEDASLTVNTYQAQEDGGIFTVDGNLEIGDTDNGGGILTVSRDDDKKAYMSVTGTFTTNEGSSVTLSNSTDSTLATISANIIDINGGTFTLTNAEMISSNDMSIDNAKITAETSALYSQSGNINITNSQISFDNSNSSDTIEAQNITISGGKTDLISTEIVAQESITINQEAEVNLTNSEMNALEGTLSITNSKVNLFSDAEQSSQIWSLGDITIDGTSEINLSGNAVIDTFYDKTDDNDNPIDKPINYVAGDILVEDSAKINVDSGVIIISTEGDFVLSDDASLNIKEDATLKATANLDSITSFEDIIADEDKLTIEMQDDSQINLSGTLEANLAGEGDLNFNSSSATFLGDADGININFNDTHILSEVINGTMSNISSININDGANLDIGTTTLTANDITFADNSSLTLKIESSSEEGEYGEIAAQNNLTIGDNTTLSIVVDSGAIAQDNADGDNYQLLTASNILDGEFDNLSIVNGRYDITAVEGNNGVFNIVYAASASDVVGVTGGTENNAETAEAWDTLASDSTVGETAQVVARKLNELSQLDAKSYTDALTALAPDSAPSVQSTSTATANQTFGAIGTRLSGGSVASSSSGMSSGDSFMDGGAIWAQGMVNTSELSTDNGFESDSNGVALGFEKKLNHYTKAGIGYAYTSTEIDGFLRATDVDTHTAFIYGEYKPKNWYINGILSYGWSGYDENKNVAGTNVNSDYDVNTIAMQAMTGYDIRVLDATITPEAGLRYVNVNQKSYTDSAEQSVSSNKSDILTAVVGVSVNQDIDINNNFSITPSLKVAMTYDIINDDANSIVTLANGASYTTTGEALDELGFEVGTGLTATIYKNTELSLNYEGKFKTDYQDHTGLLNLKYNF